MPLLGIDEVGRGPWAGPLVIGAVILKHPKTREEMVLEAEDGLGFSVERELGAVWDDLTDSKKLTRARREQLVPEIEERAFATGLGWVYADELDEIGLAASLRLAARRAVLACLENAGVPGAEKYVGGNKNVEFPQDFPVDEIVIDGTVNFLRGTPLEDWVSVLKKADLLVKEVSAASIIAKVARDEYMLKTAAEKYPGYGFESHVGYGTAAHRKALNSLGPCPEHRTSVRPVAEMLGLLQESKGDVVKNTTAVGKTAEGVVAEYLRKEGQKILAKNFKTRMYEIDIVSATAEKIYFTEVKYRQNPDHGAPLEAITEQKRRQMTFAAEAFMKYLSRKLKRPLEDLPSPQLAGASVAGPEFQFGTWIPLS